MSLSEDAIVNGLDMESLTVERIKPIWDNFKKFAATPKSDTEARKAVLEEGGELAKKDVGAFLGVSVLVREAFADGKVASDLTAEQLLEYV